MKKILMISLGILLVISLVSAIAIARDRYVPIEDKNVLDMANLDTYKINRIQQGDMDRVCMYDADGNLFDCSGEINFSEKDYLETIKDWEDDLISRVIMYYGEPKPSTEKIFIENIFEVDVK